VPSPATTSVRPELAAAGSVNTTVAGSSEPGSAAPSVPAVSLPSSATVTSVSCGVAAMSGLATGGAPTVMVRVALAVVPLASATW